MKNLLCIVIIVALLYLVWTSKEGFTSGKTPKDTSTKIQSTNTSIGDILNIASYRTSYESMVQDLGKWADQSMLNIIAQGKIGVEAKKASRLMAKASTQQKNDALTHLIQLLSSKAKTILKANEKDVREAKKHKLDRAFIDRLIISNNTASAFELF